MIKKSLYDACKIYLQEKIARSQKAIDEAQYAANNETKSSVGDKYETGRAMMQLEIEKYSRQLAEWLKMLQDLEQIDPEKACTQVTLGALVECSGANYYIAVAAGKILYDGKTYFAISPAAPIGELLMGKKIGDSVQFRAQILEIQHIY